MRWKDNPARGALLTLYERADALVAGAECACTPAEDSSMAEAMKPDQVAPCCHFALTGREPYVSAVELAEVDYAIRKTGGLRRRGSRHLRLVSELRACPLLSKEGRCTVYASRPLGCRTFFCDRGSGVLGNAREALLEISRLIADLSARAFPRDPRSRPLVGALDSSMHVRWTGR
jgi:hypothetical protein